MCNPVKSARAHLRQWLVKLAISFLARYGREELAQYTTQIVNERATELSIGIFQGMLESLLRKNACALPQHLKERKHDDWPFFLKWVHRSVNARGPRCAKGSKGYLPWPPRLVEGKGVARWENNGATSIIEIPALKKKHVKAKDVYGKTWEAIERNPGSSVYGHRLDVRLDWLPVSYSQTFSGDEIFEPQQYSPSALQMYSKKGWMKLNPDYDCQWRIFNFDTDINGDHTAAFWRWGWRPDHVDNYFNWGPFLGLRFE